MLRLRFSGDFSLRWRGREVFVTMASSVRLSLPAAALGHLI